MTHKDYVQAAEYWQKKDLANKEKAMPSDAVLKAAEEYILANNTCALATGSGDFVRCTPIEYSYRDGVFWMFSEGGEKFRALEENRNVSIAIFDKYEGFGKLKGLQVSGTAKLIEPDSREYAEQAEFKKIPLEALKKMDHPMNLLKITPKEMVFLNSDFKKDGFESRQTVTLSKKKLHVAAAVIFTRDSTGRIHVFAKQHGYGVCKGGWKFPSGEIERGEDVKRTLKREMREKLDMEIEVGSWINTIEYDYPNTHLLMDCYWCRRVSGELSLKEPSESKWLTLDTLDSVDWLESDKKLVEIVKETIRYDKSFEVMSQDM